MITALTQRLDGTGVSLDEFRELLGRLMHYGVLMRAESQVEQTLYDRFLRCQEEVHEALDLFAIGLFHDNTLNYLRLYPPGASMPGEDDAEHQAWSGGLRRRLSQHEVALALVLRTLYDQAVQEGRLDSEGYAAETVEALGLALRQQLNRSLPEQASQRARLFQRLRQLRLIQYRSEADIESAETVLRIHPMIYHFVSDSALEALTVDP